MKTLTTTLLISLAWRRRRQAADLSQAKSSARVATELQQAKASGRYAFGELDYPPALPQATSLSSQQVSDELQQAKINGLWRTAIPARRRRHQTAKSRADVQAELAQAKASGPPSASWNTRRSCAEPAIR